MALRSIVIAALLVVASAASAQNTWTGFLITGRTPANSIGDEADWFIDAATFNVWGPKTSGSWGITPAAFGGGSSITSWAGDTLGPMSNYGTSPGAVLVPGMNAFVTNTVAVSGTFFQATQPISASALPLPLLAATSTKQSDGSQKTQIVDGSGNVIASTSNNLNVQCANCSGSGASAVDEASFTAGTSVFAPSGGFFQTTATSNALTTGQQGQVQMTAQRAFFTNLRNASGAEIGVAAAPVQVSIANTGANATAVKVDGSAVTQPVSLAGTQSINEAQINGVTPLMNNGVSGTGSQRVNIASDNSAVAGMGVAATGAAVPANAVYLGMNVGGNLTGVTGDACQVNAHAYTPINISAAATTVIVAGTSAKKTYVCGMMLFSAGTTNVGIVQGSGSTCGTSTLGLIGGATSGTGPNLTAQAGFVVATSGYASAATTVNQNDICLINSQAIQVSGFIVTAVQ